MNILDYEFLIDNDEVVFEGHPDQLCDIIAERIVDKFNRDGERTAIEMLYNGFNLIVGGEIASKRSTSEIDTIIKAVILDVIDKTGFNTPNIQLLWNKQSVEINQASQSGLGDNTIAYGYYNRRLNLNITWARNKLLTVKEKIKAIHEKEFIDGKMILINGKINISIEKGITEKQLRDCGVDGDITIFKKSGGFADTGLVGRKLIATWHGNGIPHGGGAFAGKDITKGDKSLILLGDKLAKQVGLRENRDVVLQLSCVYGSNRINVLDLSTGFAISHNYNEQELKDLYEKHKENNKEFYGIIE